MCDKPDVAVVAFGVGTSANDALLMLVSANEFHQVCITGGVVEDDQARSDRILLRNDQLPPSSRRHIVAQNESAVVVPLFQHFIAIVRWVATFTAMSGHKVDFVVEGEVQDGQFLPDKEVQEV